MKRSNPEKQAKAMLKALDREEALSYAINKLDATRLSSEMEDIVAKMFWREVVVQLLAH